MPPPAERDEWRTVLRLKPFLQFRQPFRIRHWYPFSLLVRVCVIIAYAVGGRIIGVLRFKWKPLPGERIFKMGFNELLSCSSFYPSYPGADREKDGSQSTVDRNGNPILNPSHRVCKRNPTSRSLYQSRWTVDLVRADKENIGQTCVRGWSVVSCEEAGGPDGSNSLHQKRSGRHRSKTWRFGNRVPRPIERIPCESTALVEETEAFRLPFDLWIDSVNRRHSY